MVGHVLQCSVAVVVFFCFGSTRTTATVTCVEDADCERLLRPGSRCNSNGLCTNPFVNGCLHHELKYGSFEGEISNMGDSQHEAIRQYVKDHLRICNSDDSPDKVLCREPDRYFNYTEIRIAPGNWESSIFFSWILQILLSEVLGVPAAIETGPEHKSISFYDEDNHFEYSSLSTYNWGALARSNELSGDCSQANLSNESCAQLLPEVWPSTAPLDYQNETESSINGMIGSTGWYMTEHTLEQYPSLGSYVGLRRNREKLAELFKRPTTWKDYCDEVSEHECAHGDTVARRRPNNEHERSSYYVEGEYNGHFRYTEKNNCSNPEIQCTGHFIDYPCGWTSYFERQSYWNDIGLENDVMYTYSQLQQIFQSAKVTAQHVVRTWWYPEPSVLEDYVRVSLTTNTQDCNKKRNFDASLRCTDRIAELRGTQDSSCDYAGGMTNKFYAKGFLDMSLDSSTVKRTPAFDMLTKFVVKDKDVSEILLDWSGRGIDINGYDGRDAVCGWIVRNFNGSATLTQYLPPGFPRTVTKQLRSTSIAAATVASMVTIGLALAMLYIFLHREKKIFHHAGFSFLFLTCSGYFSISITALMYGMEPSNTICMAREWFELIGYIMASVPLLAKVSAINQLKDYDPARRPQVFTSTPALFLHCGIALVIGIIYLCCWTLIDPVTREENLVLVSNDNQGDFNLQEACSSPDLFPWQMCAKMSESIFIVISSILIVSTPMNKTKFNESNHTRMLVYSSFFFFVIRMIRTFIPMVSADPEVNDIITCIILCLEIVVSLSLYLLPKAWKIYKRHISGMRSSVHILQPYEDNATSFNPGASNGMSIRDNKSSVARSTTSASLAQRAYICADCVAARQTS